MCLTQGPQRSDADEAQTRGPLVSSQALYHWATVLPIPTLCKEQGSLWLDWEIVQTLLILCRSSMWEEPKFYDLDQIKLKFSNSLHDG